MREIRQTLVTFDQIHEDAVRAKHQLDAERWRAELRPRALHSFAARTTRLAWSRALVKAIVADLYPDGLFTTLVGDLDRVPRDRWPQVVAIAVALRHSWWRDGLAHLSTQLRLFDPASPHTRARRGEPNHHATDAPARLDPVKALRFAPTPQSGAHGVSSSKSRRTTRATRPANSRMPSCISPMANSTA